MGPDRRLTGGERGGSDLASLQAVAEAVQSGAGLPAVVRAVSRALDAGVLLFDAGGTVLVSAARSPADERSLLSGGDGVEDLDLRVADRRVGRLRMRLRTAIPAPLPSLIATLVAGEVERFHAPRRASQEVVASFVHDALGGLAPADLAARAQEVGLPVDGGLSVVVARAHPHAATDEGWRSRVLELVERAARGTRPGALAALAARPHGTGAEVLVLLPGDEEALPGRAADAVLRELSAGLPGHGFALGHSRVARDAADLPRAGSEALLAANVAEGDPDRPILAFEETGAYRLLLSAMSEDPQELQRFYAETVEPLVQYDEQYATDLVRTVSAFLEADGNVANTAGRLFTHRHTIRYRLERVRELTGLDVSSTDGRERLSLGLKAMRVLGITAPAPPAAEV